MTLACFLLGLCFLFLHELDAIRQKEWRIFPILSSIPERWSRPLFVWAHLPLFLWILYEVKNFSDQFVIGFSWFMLIHLLLHFLFLWHPNNEFKGIESWSFIIGAAACGGFVLLSV